MTVIERWNGHIFQVLRGPLRSSHQSLLHGIPGNGREQRLAPSGSKCCCNKVLTLSNVVYWQLDLLWYKKNTCQIGLLLILVKQIYTHSYVTKNGYCQSLSHSMWPDRALPNSLCRLAFTPYLHFVGTPCYYGAGLPFACRTALILQFQQCAGNIPHNSSMFIFFPLEAKDE